MALLWLLSLVVISVHAQTRDTSTNLDAFIQQQEDVVREIAKKASELHAKRVQYVRACQCTRHACSDAFSSSKCYHHLGTPKICPANSGRMADFEGSIFRTPPGTDPENLSDALKESICVYKDIEETAKTYGEDEFGWIYIGTIDGHFRRWPGTPRRRGDEDGDLLLRGCKRYDPRIRPWFIAASSGPKDIVLVLDKSNSMNEILDRRQKSKWDLSKKAFQDILDTLTFADFVNVVTFSDSATALWNASALTRGRKDNLSALKDAIDSEIVAGATNFTAAFSTAFELLTDACSSEVKSCSGCQKIILFLTDGKDTSGEDGESIRPSEMAAIIDDLQGKLEAETSETASIFTFSMSALADDSIPRQTACRNNGAWAYIGPLTDTLDALNSYYRYVAAGRRTDHPIWVEPYEDSSGLGLGNVTGVALPFYAQRKVDGLEVFLGVAGHRVGLHEFKEVAGVTQEQALTRLIDQSERCSFSQQNNCILQVYRSAQDERSLCADPYPTEDTEPLSRSDASQPSVVALCYEFSGNFYKRISAEVDRNAAVAACEDDGGELLSIGDSNELAFIANLASPDGSWTSARRTSQDAYTWIDETLDDRTVRPSMWGLGEPSADGGKDGCVGVDNRGTTANLFAAHCDQRFSFICKYSSNSSCAKTKAVPKRGYFKVPPLNKCRQSEEVLHVTQPVEDVVRLTSADAMCPLGNGTVTNEELVCCSSKNSSETVALPKVWVAAVISFASFFLAAL